MTSPHTQSDSMPIDVELPDPLELDKDGDLIFIVGEEVDNPKCFRVDAQAMARASPVFKTMLFGPFIEGKDQNKAGTWFVNLPVDEPDAFEIILRIIHAKFDHNIFSYTGKKPNLSLSYHLCAQTEKYLMTSILLPFARKWFAYPKQLSCERNLRKKDGFDQDEHLHRLLVSITVGDSAMFWKCLGIYALTTAYHNGQLVSLGGKPICGVERGSNGLIDVDQIDRGRWLFQEFEMVPMDVTGKQSCLNIYKWGT